MLKRIPISFLYRLPKIVLWIFLSCLIVVPSSALYAQDPDDIDDVEEFFGDDDEYDDEYDDDEYLDDDEYYDEYEDEYDEEEYDDEYDDDEDYDDEEADDADLADEAENMGYTIDLAGSSPRFVNMNLQNFSSSIDARASIEFPVLMQLLGMRFRFGVDVGTFNFENQIPTSVNRPGDTYKGIVGMGILSFPAGPGKIKIGSGVVGKSLGFMMEASYGFKVGGVLDIRGGIRATEVLNGTTSKELNLGHTGWMDGVLLLGINL